MKPLFAFDFDGVILDSNHVKEAAYTSLFADRAPEFVERVRHYHRQEPAQTRNEKIATWLSWEGSEVDPEDVSSYIERYAEEVTRGLQKAQPVPGVFDFIDVARELAHSQHVVSAGNADEIHAILVSHRRREHFQTIFGGDHKKAAALQTLAEVHEVPTSTIVFFGDAHTDYEAAREANVRFVGVRNPDLQGLAGAVGYIESFEGVHPRDFLS